MSVGTLGLVEEDGEDFVVCRSAYLVEPAAAPMTLWTPGHGRRVGSGKRLVSIHERIVLPVTRMRPWKTPVICVNGWKCGRGSRHTRPVSFVHAL